MNNLILSKEIIRVNHYKDGLFRGFLSYNCLHALGMLKIYICSHVNFQRIAKNRTSSYIFRNIETINVHFD